jgi:putative transposase
MVSPSVRRRAAHASVHESGHPAAAVCRALGLPRSAFYRMPRRSRPSRELAQRVVELSERHPRYGYRRITALLRRAGLCVNPKRVRRIRAEGGLRVRKRQRKTRRLGPAISERQKVTHPNHVWSCDFVHDQTSSGTGFKVFTMVDEHTRECLAAQAAWSLGSKDVIAIITEVMALRGAPGHLRCDNGPEFIAYAIRDWLGAQQVGTLYINPGSPWENPYIESFHDKLRDEFLNRELFDTLRGAQVGLAGFRREYNTQRPHSSLRYLTPAEFAAKRRAGLPAAPVHA